MEISSVREIEKLLRDLPIQMRKGVLRPAMRKAGQIVSRSAKVKARRIKDTGALAKSIGVTVRRDGMNAKIGPRRGHKQPAPPGRKTKTGFIDPFNYGHLVELGTAPHAQPKRKWAHPGGGAQPYLRPAIEETGDAAMDAFAAGFDIALDKQVAKMAARNKRR